MSKRIVLDATVALKWFLTAESDHDLADRFLKMLLADEVEVIVPRVFSYEVLGGLGKACNGRRISQDEAREALEVVLQLPIRYSEASDEEHQGALEIGTDHMKQAIDMTYVWLAEAIDCQWCTADEKILRGGTPAGFPAGRVVELSSLRTT